MSPLHVKEKIILLKFFIFTLRSCFKKKAKISIAANSKCIYVIIFWSFVLVMSVGKIDILMDTFI
jgi:hypothetical protein